MGRAPQSVCVVVVAAGAAAILGWCLASEACGLPEAVRNIVVALMFAGVVVLATTAGRWFRLPPSPASEPPPDGGTPAAPPARLAAPDAVRKHVVAACVVLVATAAVGATARLFGEDAADHSGKIGLSALCIVLGGFFVLACLVAARSRRLGAFPYVGAALSAITTGFGAAMPWLHDPTLPLWETLQTLLLASLSCAYASLLLTQVRLPRRCGFVSWIAVGCFAILALWGGLEIWEIVPASTNAKPLAYTLLVLNAAATLVLPALALLARPAGRPPQDVRVCPCCGARRPEPIGGPEAG